MRLQEWIHALEEGRGARVVLVVATFVGFLALALFYDFRCFKNFYNPEAMDAAQLGRNISEGKGYTTDNLRPLSMYLIRDHRQDRDPLVRTAHPDLANPPVYPMLLAGLFKAAPVQFQIPTRKAFVIYQPERWIAGLNQVLFFVAALLLFGLASQLFDRLVGWAAALTFVFTDVFWRFSVSGLSTMLVLVLLLGLVWCLALMDKWQRAEIPPTVRIVEFSILAGILLGVAAMTRYSLLWLIFPVLLFTGLFNPRFRVKASVIVALAFVIVVTPWIVRNVVVSGTPLGTAGYSFFEQMLPFPEDTLQRSLDPEAKFDTLTLNDYVRKLAINLKAIVVNDLPRLGGSWVTAFFLAGLLVPFRNPTLSRLRLLVIASLLLFTVVQAWGRTSLSDVSPEVNSENLLVLFAPLVFMFGIAFFFMLLDQMQLAMPALRQMALGLFLLVAALPLVFSLLPPRTIPYSYPPYFPPLIQQFAGWMKEKELTMSDMPWGVAWYGGQQCSALTLDYEKDFYAINDDIKSVHALYLSPLTMDKRFLMQILRPTMSRRNEKVWERFLFESLSRGEVITGFPLKKSRPDFLPDHFFITDWERWKTPGKKQAEPGQALPE